VKTIMPALLRHIASVQYSSDVTEVNWIRSLGIVVYLPLTADARPAQANRLFSATDLRQTPVGTVPQDGKHGRVR